MKRLSLHSSFFIILVMLFFIAIAIPAFYKVTLFWSLTLFVFSMLVGLKTKDALAIFFITFVLSYSVFLLFLFFPGRDYQVGEKISYFGFSFYSKAFSHALFNWIRLWSISLFSFSSAKVLNVEELVLFLMQKKIISVRLGYSLLMGYNSIAGFKEEWKLISLNLKLRGIKSKNPFKKIFPLLVYAFRSSLRGAMALRARGLKESKVFFVQTFPNGLDIAIFLLVLSVLLLEFILVY